MIQDLAKASYEEVAHLLLYEHLPAPEELKTFCSRLAAERGIPPELIAALKTRPGQGAADGRPPGGGAHACQP